MLGALLLGCSVGTLRGQTCKEMEYRDRNQIDPSPIELREVRGTAIDPTGYSVAKLCIGIFTEAEHKLMRFAQSDDNGGFALDTSRLADGDYRLVGQVNGFCAANQKIKIKLHSHQKRPLVVHMNVAGVDSCSYVELKRK